MTNTTGPASRRDALLASGALLALAPFRAQESAGEAEDDASAAPQYLFVQTARLASLTGNRLVLESISPVTIYFSDRPERIAGHVETAHMVEAMLEDHDENSFAVNPPNAALSVLRDEAVETAVVTLARPELTGETLVYPIVHLAGPETLKGGPATLFIDPIGRPASPTSVAGVHRRHRRRAVHHRW